MSLHGFESEEEEVALPTLHRHQSSQSYGQTPHHDRRGSNTVSSIECSDIDKYTVRIFEACKTYCS